MLAKVVDASVLAAFAFDEPRIQEARTLLRDAVLYEPALLLFELVNTAWKKARREPSRQEAVLQGLEIALSLPIRWVAVDPSAVFRLTMDTGLSAYDASYVYVSRAFRIPLVTFDKRLEAFGQPW